MSLEGIIRKSTRAVKIANRFLDRSLTITKPFVEKWLLPSSVFIATTFENLKLTQTVHSLLETDSQSQLYQIFSQFLTYTPGLVLESLIAIPATLAAANYYRNKTNSPGKFSRLLRRNKVTGFIDNFYRKFIGNKYVLPLATGLALTHTAITDSGYDSVPSALATAVILGTALKATKSLYNYFNGKRNPRTTGANTLVKKLPLVYATAPFLLAFNFVTSRQLTEFRQQISEITIPADILESATPEQAQEIIEEETRTLSYFGAVDLFNKTYKTNADLVKAILLAETRLQHTDNKGRLNVSYAGAKGIGQHIPQNIKELNRLIKSGKLPGPNFIESKVFDRSDPSENIRATVATLAELQGKFGIRGKIDYKSSELTAAVYNAGEGNVRNAIKRAGTNNFWVFCKYLPDHSQTISYVQQVMGLYFLKTNKLTWPTNKNPNDPKNLSSGFGNRYDGFHPAIDIKPSRKGVTGDLVKAVAPGRVIEAGYNSRNGYYVILEHGDPKWRLRTIYLHGKRNSLSVRTRDEVDIGTPLMLMGNTGKVIGQSGVHLDFRITTGLRRGHTIPENPSLIFGGDNVGKVNVRLARVVKGTQTLSERLLASFTPRVATVHPKLLYPYNAGNIDVRKQKYGNAILHYQEALKYSEGTTFHDDVLEKLGDCYARSGDIGRARAFYEKGLKVKGDQHEEIAARIAWLSRKYPVND